MQCKKCTALQQLVCLSCSNYIKIQQTIRLHEPKLSEFRTKVDQKLKQIKMRSIISNHQSKMKLLKIQALKQKIAELIEKVNIQKEKKQKLDKFQMQLFQKTKINESDARALWLDKLIQTNGTLLTNIELQKKQKMKTIQKLLRIYGMEQKKYKIQKYFTFQQNKNIIFTIDSNKVGGIPVIKANNQQILVYRPLQQKLNNEQKYEQQMILINVIKISTKLLAIAHKIFMNDIKIPFKMFHSKQYFYIGNLLINFNKIYKNVDIQLQSQNFRKAINMIQANLQYMAYVIGSPEKPFLLLSKAFFAHILNNQFKYTGFSQQANNKQEVIESSKEKGQKDDMSNSVHKKRKWQSFLKYLKPSNIEQHLQQQYLTAELIVIEPQSKSNGYSDDDDFQILQ